MTELRTLTDDELLRATAAARRAAHDAPKAMGNGSRAWADRANDWMRLADEVARRGLKQLAFDVSETEKMSDALATVAKEMKEMERELDRAIDQRDAAKTAKRKAKR